MNEFPDVAKEREAFAWAVFLGESLHYLLFLILLSIGIVQRSLVILVVAFANSSENSEQSFYFSKSVKGSE